MEFLVILTLAKPHGDGFTQITINRTVTVAPGSTRAGLLTWAFNQAGVEVQDANVLFFSAEPNALPTTLKAVEGR